MADYIIDLVARYQMKAVIFDLDGTMVDNNRFHRDAWVEYLKRLGRKVSQEEYNANVNGRTNKDVIEYFYERKMTDEEASPFAHEKEAIYRKLYQPHIEPVPGLIELVAKLAEYGIPLAIATSGIQVNIDFMFEHLPIRQYFKVIINSSHIKKGKPDPEIFLKTAEQLGVSPAGCLVFEDSAVGIRSAKEAGMKVIAIATTQPIEELAEADQVIQDYLPGSFNTWTT